MTHRMSARELIIRGLVQGVGFRPFLFGLASKYDIRGEVSNTSEGVRAVVEGSDPDLDQFISDIRDKKPLLADISSIESKDFPEQGFSSFQIVKSSSASAVSTLISPDVSICPDCLAELFDQTNRRYEYPFINCTNCGPRFTIIRDIPYDRPKTSMQNFKMCPDCQKEYDDPSDRRFHAQPNACPVCGPQVFLTDNTGRKMALSPGEALNRAGGLLKQGKIIAVKGLGGFHLAADAADDGAVRTLRLRKKRPDKPFALMAKPGTDLFEHVRISDMEKDLLASFHSPIVLLEKKKGGSPALSESIAPLNSCLGIMYPYTPLHRLLLEKGPDILVMTSGNRSGEPLSIDNQDALDAFSHIADYFLMHDRDIYFRCDDSIVRVQEGEKRFLRRSRGYAPLPLRIGMFKDSVPSAPLPSVLGCGAGMKNTICLTKGDQVFISQHIGELDHPGVYDFFSQSIDHLQKIMDIEPDIIAHDMHPGYMSIRYAQNRFEGSSGKIKHIVPVQHHHAHAAACMAENSLEGEVVAIILDGAGYGPDGNIWGGEILTCTYENFVRKAHLSYVPMPGGDKAVLEPWRMAVSFLFAIYGEGFRDLDIRFIQEMDRAKTGFIAGMIEKNLNSPLTSSTGRVFDALSSLLCIRHGISYESQAAMELEFMASGSSTEQAYPFLLAQAEPGGPGTERKGGGSGGGEPCLEIDLKPCIREIVKDLMQEKLDLSDACFSREMISRKFHNTVIESFCEAAVRICRETGIKRVVLSGGVFNNSLIFKGMIKGLVEKKIKVYTHSRVPSGDGGICLGQAVSALAQKQIYKAGTAYEGGESWPRQKKTPSAKK